MRKRKWQTLIYFVLIFVLFYLHIYVQQMYFSPEDVFYACERGLRSGPSKEIILEFEGDDGAKVLVGRQEEGLFVVPVEKTHLFFWRMQSGGVDGFFKCDSHLMGISPMAEIIMDFVWMKILRSFPFWLAVMKNGSGENWFIPLKEN